MNNDITTTISATHLLDAVAATIKRLETENRELKKFEAEALAGEPRSDVCAPHFE